MKPVSKQIYRTTAEIRARLTELEERAQRLRRGLDLPPYRQRPAQLQIRARAEPLLKPSGPKTLH
jgi:hypothetical protein